jgi:hypothetical protein
VVLDVFWALSTWHALAKLRMHTEETRTALLTSTAALGRALRVFVAVTCSEYSGTTELPGEAASRERRHARATQKALEQGLLPPQPRAGAGSKLKTFSMDTFKLHHTQHYFSDIAVFGTTDNYTTQTVSSCSHLLLHLFTQSVVGRAGTSSRKELLCPDQQKLWIYNTDHNTI